MTFLEEGCLLEREGGGGGLLDNSVYGRGAFITEGIHYKMAFIGVERLLEGGLIEMTFIRDESS